MRTLFSSICCLECGHNMEPNFTTISCSACGGAWLDARYDCKALPTNWAELVAQRPTNMWRYWELMPYPDDFEPLPSIGEGWTPLARAYGLQREFDHSEIWIKDERQQPTNSFKDRQAASTVGVLKTEAVEELVLASTGNAAAAYAAFCARAGIKLWVFLTSSVPAEKMRELALYGAEVIKITGTYDQAKAIAADFAKRRGLYIDKGAKAIPGKESMKTITFEIVEQLGWQAPDWYIQAVSGGIGPLGVLKGFEELYEAGITDRIPKLGIVQSTGCSPMVQSWEKGLDKAEPVLQPDTLITVLATGKPGLAYEILKKAIDKYGGGMVAIDDGQAFRAMRKVARIEGLSVEPATSVAFAGLEKLITEGYIKPHERVVINCSGHTFSAEKHALEDRYVLHLDTPATAPKEGLAMALEQLDEQITTIVVIDDNPHDSRLIRRLLQGYKNYRVFEAHNGPDGLDLARQRRPDLIILDLTLPEMDGFSILDAIKLDDRTKNIPVMIISAKSLTPDETTYLKHHTDSVWQKGGFSARQLADHVVGVLGGEKEETAGKITEPLPVIAEESPVDAFGLDERPHILVVDGSPSDARLMRRLFEVGQRFEVVETHTGAEALRAIEHEVPDLIISGLTLPDVEGEELLETFCTREDTQNVPIIVVSARELDSNKQIWLNSKANSVWSKTSLDRNSLLIHVETMLVK